MTPLWTPSDLIRATGGTLRVPFAARGLSIDTRTVRPGELFVALVGENRDGHAYVADALARGAAGALVHQHLPDLSDDAKLLMVGDTLEGLRALARFARARFTGRLVAVTGSVGKTTTKEMLRTILAAQGRTHAAEASYNNHWGVPLTLARLSPKAAFCVAEIGMNHAGEISPLASLARPHVALITAIERAHVGHLGGIEAIADEKGSIAEGLEPSGILILPADTPLLDRLRAAAAGRPIVTFGAAENADVQLLAAAPDAEGTDITARIAGQELRFRLPAPGRHMAINAVAALAAAAALGADPGEGARALEGFTPVAGRGERRGLALPGGSATLLDESYNASAASVRAALAVLRLQPAARRIAVLGDMLELGAEGPAEHASLAPDVIAAADRLFACGPLTKGLFDAVPPAIRGAHAPDAATLAPIVAGALEPGDAILIKGSLGSRMKLVVAAIETIAETR
ncbi:MAG TPA: UDP-N-acetylmuramoyl-tripeptide--D-alanyl-D-alanine ligase [Acetobacteraceae bacterium]|nr:UDP-N-acetylmuramoyl-tripeptide--D-alanyl-D-alanine ligase [Acetobacteraceae bacterium]